MDVRKIKATHVTGETVEAYVIPDGYVCVLVPTKQADALADWCECTAVRMPRADEGHVAFLEIEGTP